MSNKMGLANTDVCAQRALVVDDGPVERLAGKALLEKMGFLVTTAASGEEALQVLTAQPAQLVLCDVSMPGMDGVALLQASRTLPAPPLFIMATSHKESELAATALREGAAGYLTKPLRFDSLRTTVQEVLIKQD